MKRCIGLALVAMSFVVPVSGRAAGDLITIAGDPCSLPLAAKLAEAYAKKRKGFSTEASTVSCTLGVFKAAYGEVNIGVSTQNGLTSNLPKGAVNTVIAKSPIVLIVNKANPVKDLTYQELRGILSGRITNWKEVGGKNLQIKNVMLEPCVMHTMSKQVIPYGPDISKLHPGKKVNPVKYTNRLVAENEGALGQQIYGYQSDDVKVLTIDGVLPDESTLPGTYSLYQDFNVVTRGEPEGVVKDFISFAYTPDGKEIIKSMKHIPVKE